MDDPRLEYARRLELCDGDVRRTERIHLAISNGRLVAVAATILLAWQAAVSHRLSGFWPLASLVVFLILVVLHARVLDSLERAGRAQQLYRRGMSRLDSTWMGTGADGGRFLEGCPFARDLDLFGRASLFQLLDAARTQAGEETLAGWLSRGADIDEVRSRHAAVAELRSAIDFRETLALSAAESEVARTGTLTAWASSSAAGLSTLHDVAFKLCAVVSMSLVALVLTEQLRWTVLLLWLLVQSGIAGVWRLSIAKALAGIDGADRDLGLMVRMLEHIERQRFIAPRLARMHATLFSEGVPASRRIAALRRVVTLLNHATDNLWFRPIGLLLLVRAQAAVAIDRWHQMYAGQIPLWVATLGDMEALSALATYAYEHPADIFPTLEEGARLFESESLGHPLLDEKVCVRNDVSIGGPHPAALIVSGSNMSGKSTLLRAVGVNIVLALAGAPVRAAAMRLSRLELGTSMRIDDSLAAGHSRFYAEIVRIKAIVDLARGGPPAMFLLDEILGGTNSYDRRIGAEAVVRALIEASAIGLVTTHDLALTDLASRLSPQIANVHFEDRVEHGVMVFDYKMRPGVVERSNAVALMRTVGLDV